MTIGIGQNNGFAKVDVFQNHRRLRPALPKYSASLCASPGKFSEAVFHGIYDMPARVIQRGIILPIFHQLTGHEVLHNDQLADLHGWEHINLDLVTEG
ncbi:hypothetical protein [Fodinibius roseus]|uniref:hypothetical protein n=1 Tax=Fodinibius roseus TaxID=1194090 RepID=UPI00147A55B6|nr:hypothetical protein [Fodinibius roseus]